MVSCQLEHSGFPPLFVLNVARRQAFPVPVARVGGPSSQRRLDNDRDSPREDNPFIAADGALGQKPPTAAGKTPSCLLNS